MGKIIVFASTALVFLIATLWVYFGVPRRKVAQFSVLVGLMFLVSGGVVSSTAWLLGGSTNYRLTGIMGTGAGILMGGVCAFFLRRDNGSE